MDKSCDRNMSGIKDGCDLCTYPRSDWHKPEAIEEGFPMNRTFESVKAIWDNSAKDMHGEIRKRTGDYAERQGVCHEPKLLRPTLKFTVTHKV